MFASIIAVNLNIFLRSPSLQILAVATATPAFCASDLIKNLSHKAFDDDEMAKKKPTIVLVLVIVEMLHKVNSFIMFYVS